MKIYGALILFGVVLVNCQGPQNTIQGIANFQRNSGPKIQNECVKESGVTKQRLDDLHYKLKIDEDNALKCYLKCKFLKLGLMDQRGNVQSDKLKALLEVTNDNLMSIIEENCKTTDSQNLCNAAANITHCVFTALNEEKL